MRSWVAAALRGGAKVNISAITGRGTATGEGVVLRRQGQRLEVVGRIRP
jgi:hypothetical protein